MPDHEATNGVRVTTAQIYNLLQETNGRVTSVQQTVTEVLKPKLDRHDAFIDALRENKADRKELAETDGRLATVEMRVYAILAGLIAALGGLKLTGIV